MTPRELIDELLSLDLAPETARLSLRLIFRVLRDRVYEFRLANGSHMHDTMDVKEYFGQAVELLTPPSMTSPRGPIPAAPASTCRGLTVRQEQPRWRETCPACFHVHEGVIECGVDLGGGGKCDCQVLQDRLVTPR